MSAIEELRSYLERLRGRFRLGAMLRGGAIVAAIALIATLALAVVINRFEFSTPSVWSARAVLLLALALAAVFGLAMPLWRLGRSWWTHRAETVFPQFAQRLQTFAEHDASRSDPFLELLASDTLRVARTADVEAAVPRAALIASAAIGLASIAVLAWLIHSGPGYFGYAAAALWRGPGPEPAYDVRVAPGDATVRRHADQLVTAELHGLQRDRLTIHVRYEAAAKWEQTGMQPRPGASGFQFLFAGVPGDLEYFVSAGSVQTRHFHLHVVDVPVVREIRVTYRHPQWMNIADAVEAHGGDLRAIEGTQAQLEIVTDRPLTEGVLVMDDGRQIALRAGSGNLSHGSITIEKDGSYHVAARIGGRVSLPGAHGPAIRISDDYFIEAGAVKPPEVALVRPAGDYPASPIEEVTVAATAQDPFGLSEFALHYSINGGPEKTLDLLKEPGAKSTSGTAMIPLESLKLVPGDVIGIYAAARDARSEAHSAISFIQVDPFEREFSQSQQSGGGAGGGVADDQAQIAQREKEIIAATWKQEGLKESPQKQAAQQAEEQAKFLSDVQDTLRSQASSLAGRLGMRDLQLANEQFGSFQQEMSAAAAAMGPASQQLGNQRWRAAVAQEQKALQHLLRAEATFRQIEVAFGSRGGGSGAVNSAGRDLASLFDLELDTQKNQYETAQTASPASQQAAQVDDALRKLDELARRQNALAAQRGNSAAQEAQARWEQEMLRRKADELQQQLQQMQQLQRMAGGSQQQGRSSAAGSQGGEEGAEGEPRMQGANGAQSAAEATREALEQLRQAQGDMRHAVDSHDGMDARRAAERLRQAMNLLAAVQQQDVSRQLDSLSRRAAQLASRQREQGERLSALRTGRGASEMRRERIRPGAAGSPGSSSEPGEGGAGPVEGLIADRQKLVTDLGRLTQDLRAARREALEHNRAAAEKLHQALGDLEQSDTETHLQRSADLLRRGYAPLTDDAETQIAADLRHLQDQIAGARAALAQGHDASQDALDELGRLRRQLASLDQGLRSSGGEREGNANGSAGDTAAGGRSPGAVGAVAGAGGYREGPVDGAWNSGVDPRRSDAVAPGRYAPPAQTRQAFQQGMSELGRLQRSVADDPQARQQVDELIRSMQRLDPRRFPGNPAMVDELYARVLSGVDKLELQLRHEPADDQPGQVRSGNPQPVPPGYQAAVADYFRRLSTPPGAARERTSEAESDSQP